jgi:hypothetical protein
MAEIIHFPPRTARNEAIHQMSLRLVAYLSVSFYRQEIFDVPIHAFVHDMEENLRNDGIDYSNEMLEKITRDPKMLERIERMFIAALIDKGFIPDNFR